MIFLAEDLKYLVYLVKPPTLNLFYSKNFYLRFFLSQP